MKSKNKLKLTYLMGLGLIVIFSFLSSSNSIFTMERKNNIGLDNRILKTSKISEKIHINGNSEWVDFKNAGNCTGLGTSSDPYLIKDVVIDAGNVGNCIFIANSTAHFMVLNCTFTNSGGLDYLDNEGGIILTNCSNGKFINNTVIDNNHAVYAEECNNTIFIGNNFDNGYGFSIVNCTDILAYYNNFNNVDMNLFVTLSTYRFYSEQKLVFKYGGNTYKKYIGNHWNNYVQNYGGADDNNDGIGDTPIIFTDSDIQEIDISPLFYSIENYKIIGVASEEAIPGFNIFILLGIISIGSIFIIKKVRK